MSLNRPITLRDLLVVSLGVCTAMVSLAALYAMGCFA